MRNSFIFYDSFLECLDELDAETERLIYRAISHYALREEEIELNGVAKAIFSLIKPQLDANNRRYEAGQKGGRPKKEETQKTNGFKNFKNEKPMDLKNDENKKPNVNVNDNENVNVNENENVFIKEKEKKEKEIFNSDFLLSENKEQYFEIYAAECPNLPKIRFERRNRDILQLLNEFIIEIDNDVGYFRELCKKANEQIYIVDTKIDFKTLLRNHSKIFNECCVSAEYRQAQKKEQYLSELERVAAQYEERSKEVCQ